MIATKSKDASSAMREKLGRSIATLGLVSKEADHFIVFTASLKGRQVSYRVARDLAGQIVCDCGDFTERHPNERTFRCEHILAVKFAMIAKNTGPATQARTVEELSNAKDNVTTEPRRSERGEQEFTSTPDDLIQTEAKGLKELVTTYGEDLMIKENSSSIGHDADNVLDFTTTLRELRKNVDPQLVKQREGWRDRNGNVQMVDYVEWHTVADILDQTAPDWAHTVKDIRQIGDIMTVTVAITIDGITREGIGTGLAQNEMGIKKAEHDALKRAAVKFGIARDLYKKESEVIEREGTSTPGTDEYPTDPVAKSLGDLVTAKQLGMIRALAREVGVESDHECDSVLKCTTNELSKRAASRLIKHLQDMQRQDNSPAASPLRRAS